LKCPRCQYENPSTAKFCVECGAPFGPNCAQCGTALPSKAKFCPECARPVVLGRDGAVAPETYTPRHLAERILESRAALEGERKQVTVLFADLRGSMELLADRDPEDARKLLDPILERMMEAVHRYEGTVNQVMGDGIMALFGAPLAHEDHAVRACYAALHMQDAIRRYTESVRHAHGIEVQIRVGLNSGEVVVRSIASDLKMDYTAVGQTTHLAARMEQLATPGTTRLTGNTLALVNGYIQVRSLGSVPVKGLSKPVDLYELIGAGMARTRLQAARGHGLTRFVGRDVELDQLRRAADEARRGHGRIVAVVGHPGVGKSRLFYEFIHSQDADGWQILQAVSVSYGRATPYLPLADLLRSYLEIDARDDVKAIRMKVTAGLLRLEQALSDTAPVALWLLDALPDDSAFFTLEPPERRRQTLAALKRILLRESQLHPLLLVFEDLHWIDDETQAFLDTLVESLPAARILLALNYRPEYRHGWANKTYYRQLHVDPLPPQTAEDLLAALLGRDPSTESLKQLLIARTEGSPLFLEESVRTLIETGALIGVRGAYRLVQTADVSQVPASVQAIIAARVDRLAPEEKRVLQAAAVVGSHVPFALLRAIVDVEETVLQGCLGQLQTAEFLYEAQLFPELEYAFKHALTHEVAYASVLQDRRRVLHSAIVEAMEQLYADRLAEQVERLAHHAVRGRLLRKAVHYLRQAGSKAAARSANREAIAHFEEALALVEELPATTQTLNEALEIRMALGPVLVAVKGPPSAEVEALYRGALGLVDRLGAERSRFTVLWGLWYVNFARGEYPLALQEGKRLLEAANKGSDTHQLLEAHHSAWPTLLGMGRTVDAISHMEQGLALYNRKRHGLSAFLYAGHDPGACCKWHMGMARWLLGFPDDAVRHLQEALRLAAELRHPMTTVIAFWFDAWVHHKRGDREAALASLDRLMSLGTQHGILPWVAAADIFVQVITHERASVEKLAELYRRLTSSKHDACWRRVASLFMLAELCLNSGHADVGLQVLLSIPDYQRGTDPGPEFLRLEGELLLLRPEPAIAQAKQRFRDAIELARKRTEKSLELRAAISLARLLNRERRTEEAHTILSDLCGRFTQGFETADLKAAKALLAELA
jgi:class 3 adenylate cyclase/tetratricopeptide (TPR) repeat protein